MPSYYPVYGSNYGTSVYPSYSIPYYTGYSGVPTQTTPSYMINVDGEVGAKAWQIPNNVAPNTVIPLWDIDGKHVYFKSVDAYGRLNPMRKGMVVFEDEQISETAKPESIVQPDMSKYVTKEDLSAIRDELLQELKALNKPTQTQSKTNQNGSK